MHLVVILGIALLVFGPKGLPSRAMDWGEANRGFKTRLKEAESTAPVGPGDQTNPACDSPSVRDEDLA